MAPIYVVFTFHQIRCKNRVPTMTCRISAAINLLRAGKPSDVNIYVSHCDFHRGLALRRHELHLNT